jgi:hypothetical protein
MIDYKIHPVRFAGKIQSIMVVINGNSFIRGKEWVTIIHKDGYKRTINNSWYPDFKSEEEVFKYFE